MFLDDELLDICRNADCTTSDNIQQLNKELCKKCEDYYKSKLKPNMLKKDVKVILERTFILWDSFTKMAIKEGGNMAILSKLFQEYTFKKQLLSNDEMRKIYEDL